MSNEYQCCVCGGTFLKTVSDEEVIAELTRDFPGYSVEECGLVCDDCYKRNIDEKYITTSK
jgi:hypothetical protein